MAEFYHGIMDKELDEFSNYVQKANVRIRTILDLTIDIKTLEEYILSLLEKQVNLNNQYKANLFLIKLSPTESTQREAFISMVNKFFVNVVHTLNNFKLKIMQQNFEQELAVDFQRLNQI